MIDKHYNPFNSLNSYLKKPVTVSIINIRYHTIESIYNIIKDWKNDEIGKIPDRFVYLRINKENVIHEYWLKSCMIEEQIHIMSLIEIFNTTDQYQLNTTYYKYAKKMIINIKKKNIFIDEITPLNDLKRNYIYTNHLYDLLIVMPNEQYTLKSQLELYYTKLSIFEERLFEDTQNERSIIKNNQQSVVLRHFDDNIHLYNCSFTTVHNGCKLNEAYKCIICSDGCTEYADCMYSNCRHLCICYNCSQKMPIHQQITCPICKGYNDFLIQIFNP